jgi:hypothetical protein
MQMLAQLIVDGTIVHQATPVDKEHAQDSSTWKLKFDCDMFVSIVNQIVPQLIFLDSPPHASTFWIAILRKAQGTRLVGSIEIGQGEALSFGEKRRRASTIHVRNHRLQLCSFAPTPCESEPRWPFAQLGRGFLNLNMESRAIGS